MKYDKKSFSLLFFSFILLGFFIISFCLLYRLYDVISYIRLERHELQSNAVQKQK